MQYVEIETGDLKKLFEKFDAAGKGEMKKELALFLEGVGMEFLRIIEDEIIRMKAVDTRLLLNSFHKGGSSNVWVLDENGLTLEIGTNVEYAKWVNDGHRQEPGRFIPGEWKGGRFVYQPGADTGMVLKASWVEGRHFLETSIRIIEMMFPKLMEAKVEEWAKTYFGV